MASLGHNMLNILCLADGLGSICKWDLMQSIFICHSKNKPINYLLIVSHCIMLRIQYIPRNMHTVFALLCFVVVIHWLIFPYPSGLLHWHCGNLTIAPVPAKQPWWIWINTSCEFIMNNFITTTKQSTTKPCAHFLGYTVLTMNSLWPYDIQIHVCIFLGIYCTSVECVISGLDKDLDNDI